MQDAILELAEKPAVQYVNCKQIYLTELADFVNFSDNVDLFVFGELRSKESISYDIEKQVVGISAKATEISMPVNGNVILFVTDKKPLVYVCRLFLCMNGEHNFIILQKKEDCEEFFDLEGELYGGRVRWSLGIVEIKFTPKLLV